ncbi:MAG: GvpL/GvpF family gas vesicle protein, partial [Thermodesulfobacteriota bacterium]
MKYVYCLVRNAPPVPDVFPLGLGGAEVHDVSFGGISALISDIDIELCVRNKSGQLAGNVQNALVHQEVVDAALRLSKSVIPCRFGTWFSDDRKVLMLLKEHYARLDALLTKLEGRIEVSVQTIFNRKDTATPPGTRGQGDAGTRRQGDTETRRQGDKGISYLLRKKEQFDAVKELKEEADRFSRELNQAMSPFWSDVKVQKITQEETLLLSLYYLVDEQELPSFRLAYQKFKGENPSLKLLYTGPWAP